MRIPDNLIMRYLRVYTEVPMEEISRIEELVHADPMSQKKFLASKIVERYHGKKAAEEEQRWFEKTFSARVTPPDIKEIAIKFPADVFTAVHEYFGSEKSNSEIRRLLAQGAVSLNQEKAADIKKPVKDGDVFKIGKREWFRVRRSV